MSRFPKANKDFGQHFLVDKNIIKKITTDFSNVADIIFEVGPGPAVLTPYLSACKLPLYLFEKDTRFKELLESCNPNHIFWGDALTISWKDFIFENNLNSKKCWMVSNLPYNISSALLVSFIKSNAFEYMTLMFQKEVGDKVLKSQDKNHMSSLYALCVSYYDTKLLSKVPPGAFSPPPQVNSIVISFVKKMTFKIPPEEINIYEVFLRNLFSEKRKQIRNVLGKAINLDIVDKILLKLNLDPKLRAESLELEQIQNLYIEFKRETT